MKVQGLPRSETDVERKGLLRAGLLRVGLLRKGLLCLRPSCFGLPGTFPLKLFIRLSPRATDSPVVVVARLTPLAAFKDDDFIWVITESVILSDRRFW